MIGILVEKNSAARNFSTALGGRKGTYNGESYVIAPAAGHIFKFNEPEDMVDEKLYKYYKTWNLDYLPWNPKDFDWSKKVDSDKKDILKNIKETFADCDEIAIATDDDPSGEGDMIAWEIIDALKLAKGRTISRLYFIDESEKSVKEAFVKRKVISSKETYRKWILADVRSKFDFMSIQFTRCATCIIPDRAMLREGRVKSWAQEKIGDQIIANRNYKEIPYYENRFKDDHGIVYSNSGEDKYSKKEDVPQIYHSSEVVLIKTERKHKAPPRLLDMAALAASLAEKGFSAESVKNTYQKMYDDQYLSYPRTEDTTITKAHFEELKPLRNQIAAVVGVDTSLLTHLEPRRTHVQEKGTHGANRPGPKVPKSLDWLAEEYGKVAPHIYQIVARNFLALLCEDYEYDHQSGYLKDYPSFTGFCNIPVSLGYKKIFNLKDDEDEEKDDNKEGLGSVAEPFVYEGFPPKPQWPTTRWLMKEMEKNKIGTGATRTTIYAEMTNTKHKFPLVIDKKGKLDLTEYGWENYYILKNTNIGSLDLTARLQVDFQAVADGEMKMDALLKNVGVWVTEDIATMKKNAEALPEEIKSRAKVTYAKKEKCTGIWKGKQTSFNREFRQHRFTDEECKQLLDGEEITIEAVSKDGNKFKCKGVLAEQSFENEKKELIPFVGFKITGFVDTPRQKGEVPYKWCDHVFTAEERKKLAEGGSVTNKKFYSKNKGSFFEATIRWVADRDEFEFVNDGKKKKSKKSKD